MERVIIGIAGKAHSGKDTMANYLVGYQGFKQYAFADVLKSIIVDNFDVHTEELWCSTKTQEVRKLLQGTGTILRTYCGDNFFVDEVVKQIDDSNDHFVCISDVRYLNEAEAIKARNGFIIKIERPTAEPIEFNPNHDSETELDGYDGFDAVIENNRSIPVFCQKIRDVLGDVVFC